MVSTPSLWTPCAVHSSRHCRVESPGGPAPVSRAQDEADAKHRRALQESLAPLRRQEYPDVEVVERLAHESPVLALARASDLSDLLVVGTCGRGGFSRLALGSVSRAPPSTPCAPWRSSVRAHDRPRRDAPAWGAQGAQSCGDRRLAVPCRRLAPTRSGVRRTMPAAARSHALSQLARLHGTVEETFTYPAAVVLGLRTGRFAGVRSGNHGVPGLRRHRRPDHSYHLLCRPLPGA